MAIYKTFSVTADRVQIWPGGLDGALVVRNSASTASGKTLAITDVRANVLAMRSDTQIPGIYELRRCSAYSGGTALTSKYAFDTGATALPSQVVFIRHPASVTTSDLLRRFQDALQWGNTTTTQWMWQARMPGFLDRNEAGRNLEGHNIWHTDGISDTEPIILREGEGLAMLRAVMGIPQQQRWELAIKVVSTGYTFRIEDPYSGTPAFTNDASWVLMNGSGSGVTLQVHVISLPEIGQTGIPRIRLIRCADVHKGNLYTTETVVQHDTLNTLTGIEAYSGPLQVDVAPDFGLAFNYQNYQGSPYTTVLQHSWGLLRTKLLNDPNVTLSANGMAGAFGIVESEELWPGDRRGLAAGWPEDVLVLAPGEAVAVIGGAAGTIEDNGRAWFSVDIRGYQTQPSTIGTQPTYQIGV